MSISVISVQLSDSTIEKLEHLSLQTDREKSDLIEEALLDYLDQSAEHARHLDAIAERAADGPVVSHEDMSAWLRSWGRDDELPPPVAKARA